jgi:hypothetical protein
VRLCRARQQGADGCTRETADCGGWSLLPAARCFLPPLENGDVPFHVRSQNTVNFPSPFFGSDFQCCCPNTTRFDRNKLISSPAQTKIVRTLPVKAEACFHAPPSQNPAAAPSVIRPVRCMLTSLFPCRSLNLVDLHFCTCDTPSMSLDTSRNHSS